jgi:cyanophycinase
LGFDAAVVPIKERADADRDDVVAMLDGAAGVAFSGGNPFALAESLRDSAFLAKMRARVADGSLSHFGCSAGVAYLSEITFDTAADWFSADILRPGIGWATNVRFGLHWDMIDQWIPGARAFIRDGLAPGERLLAIDERTAVVGDGAAWDVTGSGAAHTLVDGVWTDHPSGDRFELSLFG